jgi:adenylate cyclase
MAFFSYTCESMTKRGISVLGVLFGLLVLRAYAGHNTDSLANLLKTNLPDTEKIEILNQLLWDLKETHPDQAIVYGKQAVELGTKINRKRSIAQSMSNLGTVFYISGNYPEALSYYLRSLEVREQLKDSNAMSKSYNNIALVYYEQGQLDYALAYHNKSLAIKLKTNDLKGISTSYGNIGNVYYKYAQQSKGGKKDSLLRICLTYQIKTLDIQSQMVERDPGNSNLLVAKSGTYNNLGNIYFEKAIVSQNPAEYQLALNYHQKALDLQQEIGDTRGVSHSFINMAGIFEKTRHEEQAILFYNKALDISIPIHLMEEQKACYEGLSDVYEKKKDFEKSLFYYKKFNSMKDSILDIAKSEQITEMQTKYDADKKTREIELLQKDNALREAELSKQKTVRNSFIIGFGLVIALVLILFNRYRIKNQAAEALRLQNSIIEAKQKEILDSIHYAKRIQQSLLPSDKYIDRVLSGHKTKRNELV